MLDPKHIHQHKTKISKADISNITVAALARCLRFVHNLTNQMIFAVRRCFTKFMRTATEVNIIHKKVEMSLVLALRICQLQNELVRGGLVVKSSEVGLIRDLECKIENSEEVRTQM